MAPVAAGLAWWLGVPLVALALPSGRLLWAVMLGLLATGPMLVFLLVLLRSAWGPLARLRSQVRRGVALMLDGASAPAILAVAIAAGIGEEALFRGTLQPLAQRWLTPLTGEPAAGWAAVGGVALLFGLLHPMSRAYVAVATLGGLYLGTLAHLSGEILSAIVAHATYDLFALVWLRPHRCGDSIIG